MTAEQITAVRAVADMLAEAIEVAGELGAPEGGLYATLAGRLSLTQFQAIIRGMERAGWIRREGHLLFYTRQFSTAEEKAAWGKGGGL